MNVLLRTPVMTRDEFLDWVERQEAPDEFDGFAPVPMTGATLKRLVPDQRVGAGGVTL